MKYSFKEIEQKWQKKWNFKVENPNYYVLSMLPYPSGRLHMGHLRNYLLGDVMARFQTLKGFKVLHPMGWDAFGLPAENAAMERGVSPKEWTLSNIKNMKEELCKIGFSFDWSREETTCLPEYYGHEQKMFLDFYKNGIAYKKESVVNWDPVDSTVLANEQVIEGRGWRSGALIEKRLLSQWFLKISDFSAELLEGLKTLDKWPEKVVTMQENWIGKSEGAEVEFEICVSPLPQGEGQGEGLNGRFGTNSKRGQSLVLTKFSREMRKNLTEAESTFWNTVRNNKLGFKFRRKYPIFSSYIADFICLEKKLIIEIDDEIDHDFEKDKFFENYGFKVLRFKNKDITENIEDCINVLLKSLELKESPHPFPLPEGEGGRKSLKIFTTRPETLHGASFIAISYAHPLLKEIDSLPLPQGEGRGEGFDAMKEFIKECERGSTKMEDVETAEKKGFFTGLYCKNPVNGELLPVYIANFVLMEYGTGALFGCPAHDQRDFEFAVKYNLQIKQVVFSEKPSSKNSFSKIETENFIIRPFETSDLENLTNLMLELNQNPNWIIQPKPEEDVQKEAKRKLEMYINWQQNQGFSRWAVFKKDTNEFVGRAGLCYFYPSENSINPDAKRTDVELGYWLFKKFHGKGYSTEIINAVLNWAYINLPNTQIVAVTNPENITSQKVLKKAGFILKDNLNERGKEEILFIKPLSSKLKQPFLGDGFLFNSGDLNGLSVTEAREKMFETYGKKVNYRLKDWGVSRQRYWGCPIPMITCEKCGIVPVPEKDLPVKLPEDVKIEAGENPLKKHLTWRFVKCPKCEGNAERETDTLDTFFESSWYFLRYCSAGMKEKAFENPVKVNCYIGGIEHAILHLLYARFFTRALKKCGYDLNFDEPFERLVTQGMVCHKTFQTLDGKWLSPEEASTMPANLYVTGASVKMSKSKKNVVEPSVLVEKYGADTARLFIASDTPPERDMEWSDEGVISAHRFLNKFWNFAISLKSVKAQKPDDAVLKKLHKILHEYEESINAFAFNKSIAKMRELFNFAIDLSPEKAKFILEYLLILIQPFTPHFACEIAEILGFEIGKFPEIIKEFLEEETCIISVQVNGKLRGTVQVSKQISKDELRDLILKQPFALKYLEGQTIKKEIYVERKIFSFVI